MKRKWTNMRALGETIERMREQGRTRQEIANALGLEKVQVKNWIWRHNRRESSKVTEPKRSGRPRKRPISTPEAMARRIRELEREVDLYRSFLQAAGRM